MARVFEGKTFALLGRLTNGTHHTASEDIIDAGGSIVKRWARADFLVADIVGNAHVDRVEEFVKRGGTLVHSEWLDKSITKGVLADVEVRHIGSTTSSSTMTQNSKSCGRLLRPRKRALDAEERNDEDSDATCHTQSSPVKRTRKSSPADQKHRSISTSPLIPSVEAHEAIPLEQLPDTLVNMDPWYGGSRSDEVLIDDQIWDATLNYTDIEKNVNKFYLMQLTKSLDGCYHCFTRWGRVGVVGHRNLETFPSESLAKQSFEKKFKAKTKCSWADVSTPVVNAFNA